MTPHIQAVFTFILFTLPLIQAASQHIPGTRWMQRDTEQFRIIYPDTLGEEAAQLAVFLDDAVDAAAAGLPAPHPHGKWPLVLTDLGVEANGFVSLAPRRSVWNAAPGEDFTAISDWWRLLAHHEGRHIAQFDAADQGGTRALRILFGDGGWGAGIVLGYPTWLLEGDAVVVETELSHEGRGRDPLFTRDMEILLAAHPDIGLHRGSNPSFRRPIPDPYRMGYEMVSWIRDEYGEEALSEIYQLTARFPFPVLGLYRASRKATGTKPVELFDEMARGVVTAMEVNPPPPLPGEVMTPEPVDFPEYEPLLAASDGMLYARKTTMADSPHLVRIGPDSREETLGRLPAGGRVSMAEIPGGGFTLAWNAVRAHPVQTGVSVSDISVAELDEEGGLKRRRTLIPSSRFLYPALSPDGARLAAVELVRGGSGGGSAIVILNTADGRLLNRILLEDESAAYPSWSPDGERLVFSVRSAQGRRIAEWRPGNEIRGLTETSFNTVKTPVYTRDGQIVLFGSNVSGQEAIWALKPGFEPYPAARGAWGLTFPVSDEAGTHFYAAALPNYQGEVVLRVPLPVIETEELKLEVKQKKIKMGLENSERPYSPLTGMVNVHSWGFGVRGNALTLGILSDDVLGRLSLRTGGLYDPTDKAPGAYAALLYTGMRPILGIDAEYRYRSADANPFHQTTLTLTADYPINLSRSGIWNHQLDIGSAFGAQWRNPAGTEETLPVAFYDLDWRLQRPGGFRAFRPEFGVELKLSYGQVPIQRQYEDVAAGELGISLPGGLPQTFLTLAGGIERRTADFVPMIRGPRGYEYANPGTLIVSSIDYEFPLGYPDLPLGALMFIQRFRMGIFSDFGVTGPLDALGPSGWAESGIWEPSWSTGAAVTVDFAALNSYSGFSLGFRFAWLWQESALRFDLLLMDLPVT